ncbi:MAG: carboxypeptidase regulatory-like domain-containing protein [Hymenobacter sp.]|nr:carboxypeptidase regulatory-like domain-containing protein [Hymenobacter sp.]
MTGNRRVSILIVRVTDPQGRPVVGARGYFTAGPEPLPEIAALTDQHGQFSLSAPAAGTYQLGCTAENFVPATVTVRVPRDAPPAPVEIRLHR